MHIPCDDEIFVKMSNPLKATGHNEGMGKLSKNAFEKYVHFLAMANSTAMTKATATATALAMDMSSLH